MPLIDSLVVRLCNWYCCIYPHGKVRFYFAVIDRIFSELLYHGLICYAWWVFIFRQLHHICVLAHFGKIMAFLLLVEVYYGFDLPINVSFLLYDWHLHLRFLYVLQYLFGAFIIWKIIETKIVVVCYYCAQLFDKMKLRRCKSR